MIVERVTIVNKLGLHARASAVLAQKAAHYRSNVQIGTNEERMADCKSIMSLMMLAAGIGSDLILRVEGEDESDAFQCIRQLIADRFGEEE